MIEQRARIEALTLLIAKLRRMQFGRSSERVTQEIEQLESTRTPPGPTSAALQAHTWIGKYSLGYGDVVMSPRHKLLGPLEAINGALMIGMSTATLIAGFQDAFQRDTGERPP